jgi:hypothetical protein
LELEVEGFSMHIFVFSVLGLFMVGGFVYLYRDIKRMSSWRIEERPGEGNGNDQLDGLIGAGLTGVESDSIEHAASGIATQVGHLAEAVGHIISHH